MREPQNELEALAMNIARQEHRDMPRPRLIDVTDNKDGTVTVNAASGPYISIMKPTHKVDFSLDENRRFVPDVKKIEDDPKPEAQTR